MGAVRGGSSYLSGDVDATGQFQGEGGALPRTGTLCADRTVMQDKISGPLSTILTWGTAGIMGIAAAALVVTTVHPL